MPVGHTVTEYDLQRLSRMLQWYERRVVGNAVPQITAGSFPPYNESGPFHITKYKTATTIDDLVLVGRHRSATEPGVLFLDGWGKTFTAAEGVALFAIDDTRLLCLRAKENAGGTGLDHEYVWKEIAEIPTLQEDDDWTYFPLAWVKVEYVTADTKYIAKRIRWPCTEWLLSTSSGGGGVVPIRLTAKTDDHTYTGNVYSNGRHNAATESSVTIKVGAIAAGETLPSSGDSAWFIAHKEKWDVTGNDVEYWTIQPEIWR